jgi:transcriptional regulator with XRE-family HTH domain
MRPSKEPQAALGAVLREIREPTKMTQREVARRAKLSTAHYCAVENGRTNPLWGTMRRIAKALDVSLKEISEKTAAREGDQ